MFNLEKAFKILYEMADEEDRPEIIKINVFVKLDDLYESLPSKYDIEFDDNTLDEWYSFVGTVEGIIENFCDVVNISMSNSPNSLSEYIDFYSYDKNGNKKNYLIDLRLSTHPATNASKNVQKRHANKIDANYELEYVTVNKETYHSYHEAIDKIRKILAKHLIK